MRTEGGQLAVAVPENGQVLRDWWLRGGNAWLKRRFTEDGNMMDFPPTMRRVIDEDALPDVVLCKTEDCGRAAALLSSVERNELRLQSYERGLSYSTAWSRVEQHGGRSNVRQRACPKESRSRWRECVSAGRSTSYGFRQGEFRTPDRGWLFLSRSLGSDFRCADGVAVNLRSGAVRWTANCVAQSGQANAQEFGDLALLAILSESVDLMADGQRLDVPVELRSFASCAEPSDVARPKAKGPHGQKLRYWLWDQGSVVQSGVLSVGSFEDPVASVVDAALARAKTRLTLVDAKDRLPEVSPRDDALLSELVRVLME